MNRRYTVALSLAGLLLAAPGLTACTGSSPDDGAQAQGQADTEQAFKQQSAAVPYPKDQLKDSLERRNIRERLLRTNNPNALQYVYVLSYDGKYLGFYSIKGKVSSTQSAMTTDQLIETKCHSGNGCNDVTVSAPGDDGSYGANEPGVFFFTTEGVMVTTDMPYVVSDAPLNIEAPKLNPPKK